MLDVFFKHPGWVIAVLALLMLGCVLAMSGEAKDCEARGGKYVCTRGFGDSLDCNCMDRKLFK